MPATSVADIEIDRKSKDLIAATHGRGMYKLNLTPIHEGYLNKINDTHLFQLPVMSPPIYNDNMNGVDYRTHEKLPITFWVTDRGEALLKVLDAEGKTVWSTTIKTVKGYNQFRWDLIVNKVESPLPYFIHYNEFIKDGSYVFELRIKDKSIEQRFTIKDNMTLEK
jgi:hypothetical protein